MRFTIRGDSSNIKRIAILIPVSYGYGIFLYILEYLLGVIHQRKIL